MVLDRGFSEYQYLNEIEQLEKRLAGAEKRIEELEKPPTYKNCETGKMEDPPRECPKSLNAGYHSTSWQDGDGPCCWCGEKGE